MELAAKLQLKPGQGLATVLTPESLVHALERSITPSTDPTAALLVFVVNRASLEEQCRSIVDAVNESRLTWVAYPKSGQLGTDLNRDSLSATLAISGIQPVRQIAIDDVWSALRFRSND
jgi:hypothetical protein